MMTICGCGFPNSRQNFEPAVAQFKLLFPNHHTILTEHQALALARTRTNALKENKRIELNGGIVDKLIFAFVIPLIYRQIITKIHCMN